MIHDAVLLCPSDGASVLGVEDARVVLRLSPCSGVELAVQLLPRTAQQLGRELLAAGELAAEQAAADYRRERDVYEARVDAPTHEAAVERGKPTTHRGATYHLDVEALLERGELVPCPPPGGQGSTIRYEDGEFSGEARAEEGGA